MCQLTLEVNIKGKVQGVYFRASTKETAEKLGLKGFVQNQPDGSVYAVVSGDEEKVTEFVNWCKQGSPRAEVEQVESRKIETAQGLKDFEIKFDMSDPPWKT